MRSSRSIKIKSQSISTPVIGLQIIIEQQVFKSRDVQLRTVPLIYLENDFISRKIGVNQLIQNASRKKTNGNLYYQNEILRSIVFITSNQVKNNVTRIQKKLKEIQLPLRRTDVFSENIEKTNNTEMVNHTAFKKIFRNATCISTFQRNVKTQ